MDLLVCLLAIIFMVPLVTGYSAHSRGRSFWRWFLLAMVLPIVSLWVLVYLPDLSESNH